MKTMMIVLMFLAALTAKGQQNFMQRDTLLTADPDNPDMAYCTIRNGNGVTVEKGYLFNNLRSGVWRSWTEIGLLKSFGEYQDDVLHGIRYEFNVSGCIELEENYSHGKLNGPRIKYNYGTMKLLEERYLSKVRRYPYEN